MGICVAQNLSLSATLVGVLPILSEACPPACSSGHSNFHAPSASVLRLTLWGTGPIWQQPPPELGARGDRAAPQASRASVAQYRPHVDPATCWAYRSHLIVLGQLARVQASTLFIDVLKRQFVNLAPWDCVYLFELVTYFCYISFGNNLKSLSSSLLPWGYIRPL